MAMYMNRVASSSPSMVVESSPHFPSIREGQASDRVNRRSRLEVFVDMMKIVSREGEVRRTHLMYKANLAWKVLRAALEDLERRRIICIEQKSNGDFVRLTDEGYSILRRFSEIESVFLPEPSIVDDAVFSGGTALRTFRRR